MTKNNREFTQEELERLGTPRPDRAKAAIEAGEKDKALKEIKGMFNEFLSMHNLMRDWIGALYTYIYKNYGDEALYKANEAAVSFWLRDLVENYEKVEPKRRAQMLAAGFRGHLVPLRVEEDDEKFTITMLPCGSGGKLVLEGHYEPPSPLVRVKKAQPQTLSRENFPIYCTHCAFQEIVPIDKIGHPIFITDCPDGDKIGHENCRVYIYKNPQDIPEKFYTRLGKTKPD
ncbi:MAG: hypothetical protein ABII26_00455 [Pseudomonadota bacterium]